MNFNHPQVTDYPAQEAEIPYCSRCERTAYVGSTGTPSYGVKCPECGAAGEIHIERGYHRLKAKAEMDEVLELVDSPRL